MEEITQSNNGAVKEHDHAGVSPDSEMTEVEQTTIGEAVQMLPGCIADKILSELPRKQTMLLSRSHNDEAELFLSKKQKHSTSRGELVACSNESNAILQSKSDPDDSLEPNVATQGPSAGIGERKRPASGQTMFRLLIPRWHDATVEIDHEKMRSMIDEKAQMCIQSLAGGEVVIVSAKEEEDSPTSPAVDSLVNIHRYFMPLRALSVTGSFQTKLLVRNEQATHIISPSIFKTIQEHYECTLMVYLTDCSLGLSVGYSVIVLYGRKLKSVIEAVEEIALILRKIPDPEGELGGRLSELSPEGSSNVNIISKLEAIRIKCEHIATRIPFSRLGQIIGENGANIKKIQEKKSVTFSISCSKSAFDEESESDEDVFCVSIEGASRADVIDVENIAEGPNPNNDLRLFEVVYEAIYSDSDMDDYPPDGKPRW